MKMIISKKGPLSQVMHSSLMPILIIACFVLAGCASTVKTAGKVAEVIYNPDIQVGPNEIQLSKLSLAVLSEDVLTTLAPNKSNSSFGSKIPANYYLLSLYELNQAYFNKSKNGILSANDALAVVDGQYLAKHQYYLKLNGYRFIEHFSVDEDVKGVLAVVNYQQPKCMVWSTVRTIKNIGEEYNFYLQGKKQGFTFRSEQDVTAPGEPIKIDNRFFGQCQEQENAVTATVNMPMSKLVQSYMNAAEQGVAKPLQSEPPNTITSVPQYINDNIVVAANQSVRSDDQPKSLMPRIVEDYEPAINNNNRTNIDKMSSTVILKKGKALDMAQPEVVVKPTIKSQYRPPSIVEDYQVPLNNHVKSKVLSNKEAAQVSKIVTQVKPAGDSLDSAALETLPFKISKQGQRVYFLTGIGYIKTKGNALVIRIEPDAKSQKLSVIGNAKSLQVLRYSPANGGWVYIESEGVKTGWVKESFVKWQLM